MCHVVCTGAGGEEEAVHCSLGTVCQSTILYARMQGLGEDVTKPKSRLEREKEAAAALRTSSDSQPLRKSISNVRSKVGHYITLTELYNVSGKFAATAVSFVLTEGKAILGAL